MSVLILIAAALVASAEREARILAAVKGTPSETEAPGDILVNKPDYVVFVPKQPRDIAKRDIAKTGDIYRFDNN